jgi:hypothetical protein
MATIDARPNEKDGSLDSSDGRPTGRAHDLDARRRAALAQADEATFSSVPLFLPHLLPLLTIIVSQMVPYEGLRRRRCRFLHRCVSGTCRSPYLTAH